MARPTPDQLRELRLHHEYGNIGRPRADPPATRFVEAAILGSLAEIVCHEVYFLSTREGSRTDREFQQALYLYKSLARAAIVAYEGRSS